MFEPGTGPRLFGLAPGIDFPAALVRGLEQRMIHAAPEDWARVTIYVNTARMRRRLREIFDAGPARLLPRIKLITDLGETLDSDAVPPSDSGLRLRLELARLVGQLLDLQPDLAPRAAMFDLADGLAALMDEMQGEGVAAEVLETLDVSSHSAHWGRSLQILRIIADFIETRGDAPAGAEARRRRLAEALIALWQIAPPRDPVLIAGSTGSRGTTRLLMEAVARLPQGALVLPGYDFGQPEEVWDRLDEALTGEDHPQFRFARLLQGLDMRPGDVTPWSDDAEPDAARNAMISLALRPAPITDQWMTEAPHLQGIASLADHLTLIEAPDSRSEAEAIALRLRQAVEDGQRAALITPDRVLTRQVAAALDRWSLIPDDSAGQPLHLSPPGRLLRQVAELCGARVELPELLALLKHPLTASTPGLRGPHLRRVREMELRLRRYAIGFPAREDLLSARDADDPDARAWADWLGALLADLPACTGMAPLADRITTHLALTERLAAGPLMAYDQGMAGELWEEAAGEAAQQAMRALEREAGVTLDLSNRDYSALIGTILSAETVRQSVTGHPDLMIWGTLEARVQGADLVILGGLNDGIWPQLPPPDPWLNRPMRQEAGLLLPERRIGLSAHDFQQAAGAPEVVLSRALRDSEAEAVPSRWLNRIVNLLGGIGEAGPAALAEMRARGTALVQQAQALNRADAPVPPARRPSPRPPVAARPDRISVTGVKTLIRDPYAIYARQILGLSPLAPLRPVPDPGTRGDALHRLMEGFARVATDGADADTLRAWLDAALDPPFPEIGDWPSVAEAWAARLERIAATLIAEELEREAEEKLIWTEAKAEIALPGLDMTLSARPDRIDRLADGVAIYDYKSGQLPSQKMVENFDKQLPLQAAMVRRGAFPGLPRDVSKTAYIGIGSSVGESGIRLTSKEGDDLVAEAWDGLIALLGKYRRRTQGYTARRAMQTTAAMSDYDHLSRFGEWDFTDTPTPEEVGE
ncbi:hypothetical protein ATO2_07995 [Roseovarius sp. 22II1-1F6A]|nr:hypothetical protein ATO2_07995 [Roseovarius sp. 22II1-1F6A]